MLISTSRKPPHHKLLPRVDLAAAKMTSKDAGGPSQQEIVDDILSTLSQFRPRNPFSAAPSPLVSQAGTPIAPPPNPSEVRCRDASAESAVPNGQLNGSSDATTPGSEWQRSPSSNSYLEEWNFLFGEQFSSHDLLPHLIKHCLRANLRSCRFRSLCWMLFLGVLSSERQNWEAEARKWRAEYERLCRVHVKDPRSEGDDHPLCQNADSHWHHFFVAKSRRNEIMKDVTRTFPDVPFFQGDLAQTTMSNVLFIYANISPLAEYKQGMHELLAPIIFVLHSDQLTAQHAFETVDSTAPFGTLFDPKYLEHDSFALFNRLMNIAYLWYIVDDMPISAAPVPPRQPFQRPQDIYKMSSDSMSSCPAIKQLSDIHEHMLKRADVMLYEHLERIEIAPQLYGIRWLRLMFGREFPLQDLLVVWDNIFATADRRLAQEGCTTAFPLINHIFVVMVTLLSEHLRRCDFAQALMHLMNYPLCGDVNHIVALSLHRFDPDRFKKPHDRLTVSLAAGANSRAVRRSHSAVTAVTNNTSGLEVLASRFRSSDVGRIIRRIGSSRERPRSLMVQSSTASAINAAAAASSSSGSGGRKGRELQRLTLTPGVESAPVTPVSGNGPGRIPRRKMRSSRSAERGTNRPPVPGPSGDFVEILTEEEERRQLEANLRAMMQSVDHYRHLTRRCGDLVEASAERAHCLLRKMTAAANGEAAGASRAQMEELALIVADLKKARDYLRGSLTLTSGEPMDDDRASNDQDSLRRFPSEMELHEILT